jgi:hypothetical protein
LSNFEISTRSGKHNELSVDYAKIYLIRSYSTRPNFTIAVLSKIDKS